MTLSRDPIGYFILIQDGQILLRDSAKHLLRTLAQERYGIDIDSLPPSAP